MQFVRHGRSLVMRRKGRRMRREGGMKDVDGQLETEWNEKFQRRRETNKNLNRNEQLNDITKSFSILLLKLLSPSRFCRRCLWKEMNQRHEIFHNFSFSLSLLSRCSCHWTSCNTEVTNEFPELLVLCNFLSLSMIHCFHILLFHCSCPSGVLTKWSVEKVTRQEKEKS